MDAKFSVRVRDILTLSHEEAKRLGNAYVGLEHFFLGLLREGGSCAIKILESLNLNTEIFVKKLEASVKVSHSRWTGWCSSVGVSVFSVSISQSSQSGSRLDPMMRMSSMTEISFIF